MYQALYRKWRPKTFADVVGQEHITQTLRRQAAQGRLSHAYLFTGTRGTGKTSCAKILSRAVNCQDPQDGNPCNRCPACLGIENGSILDVLELDAASNNGVDQVRALRDEPVYTPAAVRKRVYIVDEVHMLSTPAFNALLKILEEPPSHLMFILATTDLHKVPSTIRSRCQQFAFKRILPQDIARRLGEVSAQENIPLTQEACALLARLADGGLRDALSLLDQCAGGQEEIGEREVLDILGLAGNLETARLMGEIAARNTGAALETLSRLYAAGKELGSLLGELSALARDLLLRKTAPQGGAALLTGGYDETTLRELGQAFTTPRLLQVLTVMQAAQTALARSSNRRTDVELCLIRLCDEAADESFGGLSARVAALEERLQNLQAGKIPQNLPDKQPEPAPQPKLEAKPEPKPEPKPEEPAPAPVQAQTQADTAFWPSFAAGLRGKVPPSVMPYLNNPDKVSGVWQNNTLTLWTDSEFTRTMLNKPAILEALVQAAQARFGVCTRAAVVTGKAPQQTQAPAPVSTPAPAQAQAPKKDALDDLLAFGAFDNIQVTE